jgi:hypothetical protein
MRCKRATAVLLVAAMACLPAAALVRAAEETPVLIPYTDGTSADGFGVIFSDNMAFTPQWRVGNLIRIETLVAKAFDIDGDGLPDAESIPVTVNTDIASGTVYDQATLMADPTLILGTWMVSVPEIRITVSSETTTDVRAFYSDFTDGVTDEDTVTREINQAGHLIYGLLWDTTGIAPGVYKVSVEIPSGYEIAFPLRSLLVAESTEPIGYEVLPSDDGTSGTGGVEVPNNAYLYLGVLMSKGGSSGGGGNGGSGGHNGNGGRHK